MKSLIICQWVFLINVLKNNKFLGIFRKRRKFIVKYKNFHREKRENNNNKIVDLKKGAETHKNSNKTNELNNKNKDINDIINQKMLAIIDVI